MLVAFLLLFSSTTKAGPELQQAGQILEDAGVRGGLIVHVGCGDGRLTAALRAGNAYLVHGLDASPANVEKARGHIRSLGLYGDISVGRLEGSHLPYADNLVNLVVSADLGEIPMDEVMRVLCPNGVAYIQPSAGLDGEFTKTVKRWPGEIGEWTHYLQDASNNAVAADTQVGSPRRLKWVCGPLWTRSHEFNSSLCAMVSGKGRLFYVFDEGLPGVTVNSLPEKWTLIARDAFNGKLLWKRPLADWGSHEWKKRALRSVPLTIPRRIVAQGDRLFVTLGYDAPVSVLDAATGKILATYEETAGVEEIRCVDGILILRKGGNLVVAVDVETGRKLWEVTGRIQQFSLAAQNGRVFYQDGAAVLCLRVSDGEEFWRAQGKSPASLLVIHDGRVLLLRKQQIEALSADTGKSIWAVNSRVGRNELFVANKQLWHWQGSGIVGRDLNTGKLTTTLDTSDVFTPGHHPRCYQSKATENFIITPYRGAEFISVTGQANTQNDWLRGPCRYGIMPGNGLLYVGPNPCFCYPGVKLIGFNALAPAATGPAGELLSAERLTRGGAYQEAKELARSRQGNADDWPTYRHDAKRSGAASCDVPSEVSTRWSASLRGKLTPPVLGGDRLYVAAKDEHTLYAFDAEEGRRLWNFTSGGRIDSPCTIYGELVLFGSADGCVYCLRASNGQLIWRFRAASSDRQIIAFGQLESPWRVHGSILIKDGVAYCTAGRSTYLDGGIWIFGLDPATGKVLHETCSPILRSPMLVPPYRFV
jgi:outer membrane protein assembly factor BamB